jgi:hypothetical protein
LSRTAFVAALAAQIPTPTVQEFSPSIATIGADTGAGVVLLPGGRSRTVHDSHSEEARASLAISALVIPSADLNGLSWASESGQHLDRGGGLQIAVFQFSFWVTRLRQNPTNSRAAIVAVLAGSKVPPLSTPPANFRVVAIMSSLNEADIIGPFCGPASTVEGHGHHPDMSDCVSMPTHRLPCSRAQDKIFRGDFPGADE